MRMIMVMLLCVSCVCCSAQVMNLHNDNEGMLSQCDTIYSFPNTLPIHYGNFYPHDTLPVIMLVCDTSNRNERMAGQTPFYSQDIFWRKGYVVIQEIPRETYGIIKHGYIEYKRDVYLDENKKPLSKHILVWLSK